MFFFMLNSFTIWTSWNRNCMWLLILICMKQPSYVFDVCVTLAIGWDIDDRPSTLAYWLGGYYLPLGPIDLSCLFSPSRPWPLLLRLLLSSPTIRYWCSLSPASQIASLFPFIPRRLWHSPYPSRRSPGFLWTGTAEPVCMNNQSWILITDNIPSHFRAKPVTLSNYWARRNKDKNGRDKRDSTVWKNEKDTALTIFFLRFLRCCSWVSQTGRYSRMFIFNCQNVFPGLTYYQILLWDSSTIFVQVYPEQCREPSSQNI